MGPLIVLFVHIHVDDIFQIKNEEEFNKLALQVFQFQYYNNNIYQQFVNFLFDKKKQSIDNIKHYTQIPFLPIEFFKSKNVTCFAVHEDTPYFLSSGTTQKDLSKHYILDETIYQKSILTSFQMFFGNPEDYLFVFLLPDEKERPNSSLIYMARYLMHFSKHSESGFYLNKINYLPELLSSNLQKNTKVFILGISYALMDFCELGINFENAENVVLMETGGMKGKRQEMPKKFFHNYLKNKLGLSKIYSEYGMTELFSQAYSKQKGLFHTPPWMKILVRELDDPLCHYEENKQGLISIIDLANVYTCSFIATSDIGKIHKDRSFEVLGRSDFSDIRGCNLMYQ